MLVEFTIWYKEELELTRIQIYGLNPEQILNELKEFIVTTAKRFDNLTDVNAILEELYFNDKPVNLETKEEVWFHNQLCTGLRKIKEENR